MILRNILISTVIALMLASSCIAYQYYEAGKKHFEGGEYEKASRYLKQAVKNHPTHLKCRYFYAQSLINTQQFKEAQKQYEKIIELSPLSYEAKLAAVGIAELEKFMLAERGIELDENENKSLVEAQVHFKSGDNYIANALDGGKITRWSTDKMPIKLYIERPVGLEGYKDSYYAEVKRAMEAWVYGAGLKLISYEIVNTQEEGDIRVYFVKEILKKTGKAYVAGLATPFIRKNILYYFEIKLIPQENLYTTVLHEFGHALGISGHSSDQGDIMYASVNEVKELSSRDKNTLAMLYKLDPDISNFDEGQEPEEKSAKNEEILGSSENLLDKKLKEAKEYTEKYPNNVLSWVHLGNAYFSQGKYQEAAVSLEKAMEIDSSHTNGIANLALTYTKLNRNGEAEKLFSKLVEMEPGNISFANNYSYFLTEQKRYSEAKEVLNSLYKVNSDSKEDPGIKELMDYLRAVSP